MQTDQIRSIIVFQRSVQHSATRDQVQPKGRKGPQIRADHMDVVDATSLLEVVHK